MPFYMVKFSNLIITTNIFKKQNMQFHKKYIMYTIIIDLYPIIF